MSFKGILKNRMSDISSYILQMRKNEILKGKNCRILMYHAVENSNLGVDRLCLAVPPKTFYMQMKYLKDNEYHVIHLSELVDRIANRKPISEKSIVITFDDGYKSIRTEAQIILKEFDYPATLFVNINFIEKKLPHDVYWQSWESLNWEEIQNLSEDGMSIGSHAITHRYLAELDDKTLEEEIRESQSIIENHIQNKINMFSYPHGCFNNKVIKALNKNKFVCSCSSIEGTNGANANIYVLKRTEITPFDHLPIRFENKLIGSHDWLGKFRKWNAFS